MVIRSFGVVGAGQMGQGIAQVAATGGLNVVLNDLSRGVVDTALANIRRRLERAVEKGTLTAVQVQEILGRLKPSTSPDDMASVDFVIEAAVEKEEVKFMLFQELDTVCPEQVILASNTSSIPIGRIAAQTRRPEKVIGMHFMNPAPVMALVEVIRGLATSDGTFAATWELCKRLGKTPAEAKDFPGFIANRLLMPMINEAVFCLYQGVGKAGDIDTVMKLGMNHPMGPLALADLIGLDTCLAIMESLYDGFKDSKYRPCPLLRQYVEAGWLGRKTGRGFYLYSIE